MRRILHDRRVLAGCAAAAVLLVAAAAFAVVSAREAGNSSSSSGPTHVKETRAAGYSGFVAAPVPQPASGKAAAADTGTSGTNSSSSTLNADLPDTLGGQRYLVRTGDMSVVVAKGDVPGAAARVVALTTGYGGYVLSSQVSSNDSGQRPFADITVRIPARLYDVAIQRFGQLGSVRSVNTSAQDVTGQYVDLRAQLSHERKVEQRLLGFLQRANTVTEALAVQSRIDATELRVEQLAGQLKALHEQVAFSTLTVSVTERHHVVPASHRNSFVAALASSGRHLVAGLEAILVGVGAVLPYALLLAALGALVWLVARRAPWPRRQAPAER